MGRSIFYILETYYHGLSILKELGPQSLPQENSKLSHFFNKELNKRDPNNLVILPESLFMSAIEGLGEISKNYRDNHFSNESLNSYLKTLQKLKDDYSFKRIDG